MNNAANNNANENGYVIYPDSVGRMDLSEALEFAREASENAPYEARVENCDTNAVVGRFSRGQEV